ncbi:MAG: hypothetical protein IT562_00225 [Alphaproteobacteria bacterium]|nr:hypothetical protein [Alphaproteobacteria bacterium]
MAALVAAIHVGHRTDSRSVVFVKPHAAPRRRRDVDARDKPGHDDLS